MSHASALFFIISFSWLHSPQEFLRELLRLFFKSSGFRARLILPATRTASLPAFITPHQPQQTHFTIGSEQGVGEWRYLKTSHREQKPYCAYY